MKMILYLIDVEPDMRECYTCNSTKHIHGGNVYLCALRIPLPNGIQFYEKFGHLGNPCKRNFDYRSEIPSNFLRLNFTMDSYFLESSLNHQFKAIMKNTCARFNWKSSPHYFADGQNDQSSLFQYLNKWSTAWFNVRVIESQCY